MTFRNAILSGHAFFSRTTLANWAKFHRTIFESRAHFNNATFKERALFNAATFGGGRSFFLQTKFEREQRGDGTFTLYRAVLSDCEFQQPVTYREAVFADHYPDWTGAVLPKHVEFTAENNSALTTTAESKSDVTIVKTIYVDPQMVMEEWRHWPEDAKVTSPKATRESCATMRHEPNQQGLPKAKHFFFRIEMAFAEPIGGWWQRFRYRAFDWVSEYGHTLQRSAGWMFPLWFVPALVFS